MGQWVVSCDGKTIDNRYANERLISHMKTATVADLRNHFPKIAAWISTGEDVLVTRRGKVLARMIPECADRKKTKKPDFAARRKETWGGRVFSLKEVGAMRDAEFEGGPDDLKRTRP